MASVSDHIKGAIDSFDRGELDFAVLHACLAVDGTTRKIRGGGRSSRSGFINFLRQRYWLIEPTAMPGINLELTRFPNVPLTQTAAPDWAEIVYEVFRCAHAHGDEVPAGFTLTRGVGLAMKSGRIGEGVLEMPDHLPFGLLFCAVLADVNTDESVPAGYHLTLGHLDLNNFMQFPINDWWGCETEFGPIAAKHNKVRVHLNL